MVSWGEAKGDEVDDDNSAYHRNNRSKAPSTGRIGKWVVVMSWCRNRAPGNMHGRLREDRPLPTRVVLERTLQDARSRPMPRKHMGNEGHDAQAVIAQLVPPIQNKQAKCPGPDADWLWETAVTRDGCPKTEPLEELNLSGR